MGAAARKTLEERKQSELPNEPQPEPYDFPTEEAAAEDSAKADTAVLSDPKWIEPDTLFHQETEVSVQVATPPGKEHITKVQAELFAKTPSGPEPISKGEGHTQADGRAIIKLPVYKPKGHKDGLVEYFVEFTHKLAKVLCAENLLRKVTDTALKSADHELVPGIAFEKNTSFISPKSSTGLKQFETKYQEWDKKYPKGQIVVFGHTDKDELDGKALSERRAQSAFAFITNDSAAWEKLCSTEKWGLKPLQDLLKDLGHYIGTVDGQDGPKTQSAFKSFQKGAGLPESGKEDTNTRKALFSAYMKGKHDIKIEASRFSKVAGRCWMGCGQNNHVKAAPAPENRRVTFILINPSKFFPVYFPCQDGIDAACKSQCKKEGKRSASGIKCLFYDELVREKPQEAVKTPEKPADAGDDGKYSIEKAVAHLNSNAHQKSTGKCATYVRLALQAGGGVLPALGHEYAKEYGPVLSAMGFQIVDASGYTPKKGDLAVFQPPAGKNAGHIQMHNGTEWVSDFFQGQSPDIYPGPAYRSEKVTYEIYRP